MRSRIVTVLLLFLISSVEAAQVDDRDGTARASDASIETIPVFGRRLDYLVTESSAATRTNTPIMQTPVSVQVVPQQVMADQQVTRLEEAVRNVSGIYSNNTYFGQFADEFSIRGFRSGEVVYRDGFRMDTLSGKYGLANVERVEVVKGPASVLYGRMEPGGMVNYVTKQPSSDPYYAVSQQVGSFNSHRTTADLTGPLDADGAVAYRINAEYENSESFRQFVDAQRTLVAPTLRWQADAQTVVTLGYEYFDNRTTPDNIALIAFGNRPLDLPDRRNLAEPTDFMDAEKNTFDATVTHDWDDVWRSSLHLSYTNNHEKDGGAWGDNVDDTWILSDLLPRTDEGSQVGLAETIDQHALSWTFDTTAQFEQFGLRHTLLVGVDGHDIDSDTVCCGIHGWALDDISISAPIHRVTIGPIEFVDYSSSNEETWHGYYAQDQIEMPQHVFLLVGGRYDSIGNHDKTTNTRESEDGTTPRVGVLWQPVRSVSLYSTYSENFGASNSDLVDANGRPLKPESAEQIEVGAKFEVSERLMATLSVYSLTKKNIATADLSTPDPYDSLAIGKARSRGLEVDITGELASGWDVIVAYAYTQTKMLDDLAFVSLYGANVKGNELSNVPTNGGRIWTTYSFANGRIEGLTVGGGVTARGARQGDLGNDFVLPGYATVDLMAAYAFAFHGSHVTAQLNVDNVLDRDYYDSSADYSRARIMPGTPRAVMGQVRVEF